MRAFDTHIFPGTSEYLDGFMRDHRLQLKQHWGVELEPVTEEEMIAQFRRWDIQGLLWALEAPSSGKPVLSNQYVATLQKSAPDVFVGAVASVDPNLGQGALDQLEQCVSEFGMIGLTIEQMAVEIEPNDRSYYPLWEKCVELDLPLFFHMGSTGMGGGAPGGMGVKLKYTRPILVDEVAADFPELTIVATHPAWPWQDEMIAVALHKGNVYLDCAGYAPRYFPDSLKHEMNSRLQDKVMYGSDYPAMSPSRWLEEFDAMSWKDGVSQKILRDNALRVLGPFLRDDTSRKALGLD